MKKILALALLVSLIILLFSQLALVYAKQSKPESEPRTCWVTPCLIPGVTREDANYRTPRTDPPNPEPPCNTYGVTPCLIPGVTREDANYRTP